jgi:4-diphosphocytidyl-2-C-methyl-D-erythritol kinase
VARSSTTLRRAVPPANQKKQKQPLNSKQASHKVAVVPSFAKLNLDLRILHRRSDGFHELRTIFQTINLHDNLTIEFKKSRQTRLELDSSEEIEDNIVLKAARAVLEYMDVTAQVHFSLDKKIPIGAGLGGGSSNAAAVLVALPALAGQQLDANVLQRLASWLGSDVPFFLYGGTALGLGRGTELYPLPDIPSHFGVVVPGNVHVSTAEAYRDLQRPLLEGEDESSVTGSLTSDEGFPILGEFQAVAWALNRRPLVEIPFQNQFEPVVMAKYPQLAEIASKLHRSGASLVRMTGSGSAFFGLTVTAAKARQAAQAIPGAIPVKFLTRKQYRKHWAEALGSAAAYSELCRR